MKTYIIKIHSVVDLITNSSTVIYTNSSNSVDIVESLVNEFLTINGIHEDCEKVLDIELYYEYDELLEVMANDRYDELYYDEDGDELPDKPDWAAIQQECESIIKAHLAGETVDSDLLTNNMDNLIGGGINSFIKITAKDSKYEKVAELLVDLIYSVERQEGYNN